MPSPAKRGSSHSPSCRNRPVSSPKSIAKRGVGSRASAPALVERAHAGSAARWRSSRLLPQRRQPVLGKATKDAVRRLLQVRLEVRGVRAVHDRLPEQVFLRNGSRRLLRRRRRCGFCHVEPSRGGGPRSRTEPTVRPPPGSTPSARRPCWICRRAARFRPSPSSTTGAVTPRQPDRAPRPAPRAALRQRRLPRAGCRIERFRSAYRRVVGVLVRRVSRAPAERQHHRAARAALLQRPSLRGRRGLVVHRPAVLVPLALMTASAPTGVWAAASDANTMTARTVTTTVLAVVISGTLSTRIYRSGVLPPTLDVARPVRL